ncbi:hypothetical protein HFN72_33570 [Rhizobium laguerreae]|uniref:hypothetical protein n=1 Tax=Rhizobium laguerreae TaxID=1076926 RepID=UPI001C8FBDDC|nr:hypothetical protein [Rhizobium laguerreae]MBY3530799.1 hypothetical protein [Rhizobium laguerreae]
MVDEPAYPGMPRWVKICGVVLAVAILLTALLMVSGIGGQHGPGRHLLLGDTGRQEPNGGVLP